MSRGLYTVAEVARYLGKRPQEVVAMIERDKLPACNMPGEKRLRWKFTLHGLHRWLSSRSTGGPFMTLEELAWEIERAQVCEKKEEEEVGV